MLSHSGVAGGLQVNHRSAQTQALQLARGHMVLDLAVAHPRAVAADPLLLATLDEAQLPFHLGAIRPAAGGGKGGDAFILADT